MTVETQVLMNDDRRRAGLRLERVHGSAQWFEDRFRNAEIAMKPPTPGFGVMVDFFFKPGHRTPTRPLPLERPHAEWLKPIDTGLRTTWLGHSTVLIEIDGRRMLTDPVFGERASPFDFAGPKRFHKVPAELDELPPLDVVLLSHDHFDHLCRPTMQQLARMNVPIVTSLGVGAHLERFGVDPRKIVELDWHESAEVGGLRFTATPAQHFSGRGMHDRNKTLWSSWVVSGDRHKVFFSGDTGHTPEFAKIGERYGSFDLVMLEIGAWHPAWGTIHLGPENALDVHRMLGGKTLMPVHWGTFNLALHDWDEPAETLITLAPQTGARVITPRLGAVVEPARIESPDPWWRGVEPRDQKRCGAPD